MTITTAYNLNLQELLKEKLTQAKKHLSLLRGPDNLWPTDSMCDYMGGIYNRSVPTAFALQALMKE